MLCSLGEGGPASFAVGLAIKEVSSGIEEIVDRAVDGGEFLQGFHLPKT
jgi:hypothetical protein